MTETTICIHSQNFPKLLWARSGAQIHSLGSYSTHTSEQGMGLNGGLGTVPGRGLQGGTALVSRGFPGPTVHGTGNMQLELFIFSFGKSTIQH